jgi:hypothetical protein
LDRDRAAQLSNDSLFGQRLNVAVNGHTRNAEAIREFLQTRIADKLYMVGDCVTPIRRLHRE